MGDRRFDAKTGNCFDKANSKIFQFSFTSFRFIVFGNFFHSTTFELLNP